MAQGQWREVQLFFSATLAEPAWNAFRGLDLIAAQQLAYNLINEDPSSVLCLHLNPMQGFVFLWQFLLLFTPKMGKQPLYWKAVRESCRFVYSRKLSSCVGKRQRRQRLRRRGVISGV